MGPVDGGDTDCRDGKDYRLSVVFEDRGKGQFLFVFDNARNGRVTSEVFEVRVTDGEADAPSNAGLWPGMVLILLVAVAVIAGVARTRT